MEASNGMLLVRVAVPIIDVVLWLVVVNAMVMLVVAILIGAGEQLGVDGQLIADPVTGKGVIPVSGAGDMMVMLRVRKRIK